MDEDLWGTRQLLSSCFDDIRGAQVVLGGRAQEHRAADVVQVVHGLVTQSLKQGKGDSRGRCKRSMLERSGGCLTSAFGLTFGIQTSQLAMTDSCLKLSSAAQLVHESLPLQLLVPSASPI